MILRIKREKICKNLQSFNVAASFSCIISLFQDYIIRRLQMENDQIAEDERLIKQYREDTDKKRAQIEELKTT